MRIRRPSSAVRHRHWAFTLVEIMIAIGILAMVMVAIFASWNAILRGSKAGQLVAAEVQRNRMSMSALQSALFSAQMFGASIQHYYFTADTSSDFAYLSLVSHLPVSFPGSGLFGDQAVRRVTFSVEPGANSQNQLVMRQRPLLEATNRGEEAYTIVLARDVSLFMLEFWDMRLNDWASEWLFTNQLPKMVRVTLGIGNQGSKYSVHPNEILSRVVSLSATNVSVQMQQGQPAGGIPGGPAGPRGVGGPNVPGGPVRPGGPGRPGTTIIPAPPGAPGGPGIRR